MYNAPTQTPRLTCALTATLAVFTGTALVLAGGSITIAVNDEEPIVLEYDPFVQNSGAFNGTYVDPDGRWTVNWNYAVNADPSSLGSMIGSAKFTNASGQPAVVEMLLDAPVCPIIVNQSLMGGSLTAKLFIGSGAALLQSVAPSPVFSALADEDVGGMIFAHPFTLGGGGGIVATTGTFGAPYPNQVAPPVEEAAGMRLRFSLTDGDTAEFISSFYFGGDAVNFVDCDDVEPPLDGDLTGDGQVGSQDLIILLASWGKCPGCPADITGNGMVGLQDLLILVSNWTAR